MWYEAKQNVFRKEAKIKTNQYIEAVYGAKGTKFKKCYGLTENDFTRKWINLDTQKMSAYMERSMNEMMSNINELKGLEPLIRVTDEVLSNSNSRNAIATLFKS